MKVFLSVPDTPEWDAYFPKSMLDRLKNEHDFRRLQGDGRRMEALLSQIGNAEAVITHWGTPKFDESALDACPRLRILAHAAGSVAGVCSDAVFDRGFTVLSANLIMSRYVAEAILGMMLSSLRNFANFDARMKAGEEWPGKAARCDTLYGAKIGFVGLGAVGRALLTLLAPFAPAVYVYDPYIPQGALAQWPFAARADTLDEALAGQNIVSLHVSKTRETLHMLDARALARLDDGTLLINCARGAVIDESALTAELASGRIRAALDVYEREPLAKDSLLRTLPNVCLLPHLAGSPARWRMTEAILDDLAQLDRQEAPLLRVTKRQYELMTHESL